MLTYFAHTLSPGSQSKSYKMLRRVGAHTHEPQVKSTYTTILLNVQDGMSFATQFLHIMSCRVSWITEWPRVYRNEACWRDCLFTTPWLVFNC